MRSFFFSTVLLVTIAGCGQPQLETAGGKPVSHWVDAIHSPKAKERMLAVKKLANVGAADPAAIPALIEAVKDADPEIRAAAITGLLPLGSAAKAAVPTIELATRDRDAKVRSYAAKALEKLREN